MAKAAAATTTQLSTNQVTRFIENNRDALLPLGLIGILMIMIVPVPPWMMDLLLTLSITSSLLILFVGMYTEQTLDFSAFPSLLLIATLFRLALNIGTTRLILLNGNEGTHAAGGLIQAFGDFVVGGNYVVGLIIFVILIVINFVVITKGAGRIAEVSARFTLDAMPGKQMSIDADLNAGLISEEDARTRRKQIEQEADFYGAMDGASKFVRGDAIAGIVILMINIIGGLIIGVMQHHMALGDAATVYTLLTVGDGLVSQIPSLIVSTAAGLVVTKATSEANLSQTVSKQLLFQPKALLIASLMLVAFGILPGMPLIPFWTLAAMTGFVYQGARKALENQATIAREKQEQEAQAVETKPEQADDLLPLELIALEVGYGLISLVDKEQSGDLLDRIKSLRRQLANDIGFVVPPVHIRDNLELAPNAYSILIKGCDVATFEMRPGHLLAMAAEDADVSELGGVPTTEPAFGLPAFWIPDAKKETAQAMGFTVVNPSTVITTHLTEVIKRYAHELLTRQETQNMLDTLKSKYPKVVEGVVPDMLPLGLIQKVLQNLLSEQVSVRDMLTIIETMTERASTIKDPDVLTEYVRQSLARHIVRPYLDYDNRLQVMVLDRQVEEMIMQHTQHNEHGIFLTLDPGRAQQVLNAIEASIEQCSVLQATPLITCLPAVRLPLRRLIEKFFPQVVLLSHNEIPQHVKVESLGVIGLNHAAA